jgi:hypothetical protein
MVNLTTTETSVLAKLTQRSRAAMLEALGIRHRDYDGFVPPDVVEMREIQKKIHEHDGLLGGLFKQLTVSFSPLLKLDEKIKNKK